MPQTGVTGTTNPSRWRTRATSVVSAVHVVGVALVGAVIAIFLLGAVTAPIGPFDTTVSMRPSLRGNTAVRLAPLGSIRLDTHDAPVGLEIRVDELRLSEAEGIARDPRQLASIEADVAGDAREALRRAAVRGAALAMAGGGIAAFLLRRRVRSVVIGAGVGAIAAAALTLATVATFDADALAEPHYSGLMTVAPTAVGDVEDIVERFGQYRAQLTELVGNVVTLYDAAQGLPTFDPSDDTIRVLHVSDIHLNPQAFDLMELLVTQFNIDAVADTGDITDWGSEPEAQFVSRISQIKVPYVWVRGNHDSAATQTAVKAQPNAVVLDSSAASVAGLRLWGAADTRFTPNKDQPTGKDVEAAEAKAVAPRLAKAFNAENEPPADVVLVHDQRMASSIAGHVPLVLSGHTHVPRDSVVKSTRVLVEGSTGGAGLRALRGQTPKPLTCTILYFDRTTARLIAYDRVTVRGLGQSGARIERHVIEAENPDAAEH